MEKKANELVENGIPLTNEEQGAANPDENPGLLDNNDLDESALQTPKT